MNHLLAALLIFCASGAAFAQGGHDGDWPKEERRPVAKKNRGETFFVLGAGANTTNSMINAVADAQSSAKSECASGRAHRQTAWDSTCMRFDWPTRCYRTSDGANCDPANTTVRCNTSATFVCL